jgi:predicted nucleic acid-binding protein
VGKEAELTAVTDAGPLIHLHEIGLTRLLAIFDRLFISDDVWAETVGAGRVADVFLAEENVERRAVPPDAYREYASRRGFGHLQNGELSGLYLCESLSIPIFLTDDLAARDAAKQAGVIPVGTLGIVVRAFYRGMIDLPSAERALLDLAEISSLFVTPVIVDLAREQLRKPPT